MKRILFTHGNDIDGMGNAILALLAWEKIEYILCKNVTHLEEVFLEKYNSGYLYNYDIVYITDLSLKSKVADMIFKDEKIKGKLYIFDHHETALNDGLNNYSNCTIKIQNDLGKMCATQIYYEYLLKNGYLKQTNALNRFVEMIRREDIWEWKKYNDQEAHDMSILFNEIGPYKFINKMIEKLKNNNSSFSLSENEIDIVNEKKNKIKSIVENTLQYTKKVEIDGIKLIICFIIYEYRNEVADYLKENNIENQDVVAMIALDNNQVSLRSLKDNSYSRIIAEKYNGGGHDNAAAIPITNDIKSKIIDTIFKL